MRMRIQHLEQQIGSTSGTARRLLSLRPDARAAALRDLYRDAYVAALGTAPWRALTADERERLAVDMATSYGDGPTEAVRDLLDRIGAGEADIWALLSAGRALLPVGVAGILPLREPKMG